VTQVIANGNTYSDDGTAAKDMQNGGHRTHLLPMLSDVLLDVADAATDAATASAAATSAQNYAAALNGTSTTSLTVGVGTKNIATQSGKNFVVGEWLLLARTAAPSNYMVGQVTSYSGTALVMNSTATGGSGTYTDWTISPSGAPGPTGVDGPVFSQARSAKTTAYTLVAGDKGNLVDCTSGTFTLAFTAAATLTSGWWCEIRNSGSGDVTLDPNSAEQIDGLTSFVMYPGEVRRVFCTGTAFVSLVLNPFYRVFATSGSWIEPPGYKLFEGLLWAAGGGGGRSGSGSFIAGGGGAGGCTPIHRPATTAGTSVTVTIATATSNQTGAGNGATGGTSTFGGASAYGGGGGYGNSSGNGFGGGGGGPLSAGTVGGTSIAAGGAPASDDINQGGLGGASSSGSAAWGGAGGGGDGPSTGGSAVYGGGGGGRGAGSSVTAGSSVYGGGGGAGSSAANGADGATPGGGGGGTQTGTQAGAGARGELRIWGVV